MNFIPRIRKKSRNTDARILPQTKFLSPLKKVARITDVARYFAISISHFPNSLYMAKLDKMIEKSKDLQFQMIEFDEAGDFGIEVAQAARRKVCRID